MTNLNEELNHLVGHNVTVKPMLVSAYCRITGTLEKVGLTYSVDTPDGTARIIFHEEAVKHIDIPRNRIYLGA